MHISPIFQYKPQCKNNNKIDKNKEWPFLTIIEPPINKDIVIQIENNKIRNYNTRTHDIFAASNLFTLYYQWE